MNETQYYVPPSQEVFDDIKQAAIQLWSTYDDTYKYATGKIGRIKDLENVKDNYAYMIAMFDPQNQNRLLSFLKDDNTRTFVGELLAWSRGQL